MTVRHLALVGPTATGKSALGLRVAGALGDVEIVSLDSMQVYRGMDIGTAKPTPLEQAEVPHHLVDVVGPDEEWSMACTQRAARAAVSDIEARGKRALLLGGTGLYVRAVVDDLEIPGEDPAVRAELVAATSRADGLAAAYAELEEVDPVAAERIDEQNQRRVVRALEVYRVTGRPFSSFGDGLARFGPPRFPVDLVGVWMTRPVLAERIATRVESMRRRGFRSEVEHLAAASTLSRSAAQAIGYQELLALGTSGGESDSDAETATFAAITARTRSFARRQRMWFRRDPRITWFATGGNPGDLAAGLLARWRTP